MCPRWQPVETQAAGPILKRGDALNNKLVPEAAEMSHPAAAAAAPTRRNGQREGEKRGL